MKKIVLLFAAVVLLASCVKENTLAPEQTGDNLVTIKALAMDTKTTLGETTDDQTAVLWEGNDKIMVVYENVDGDNNNDDIITEFAINGTPEGSSATFKGQYNSTGFPAASQTRPFAVYPSSSVTDNGQGKYTIKHNLPDVQDGKDLSGRLLSTAILKDEDLMAGTASATFKNALTLLYVTVPEGVKSVALTASYGIVGDATFTISNTYSSDSVWDDDLEEYVSDVTEATGKLTGSGNKKTVTLSNEGNALEADTYPVLIYPGYTSTFTVTMTGTSDDVKFEKTLADLTFTAGEFRNLNLTQIFQMEGIEENKKVSSAGESFEISVAATEEYTYTVDIDFNGKAKWITFDGSANVETKAFSGTKIVFTAEANYTGEERTASITIEWNDGQQSRTFTVTQDSPYLGFVYVDGDPTKELIQWEETFGIYASQDEYDKYKLYLADPEADANKGYKSYLKKEYKNTFTIALTSGDETRFGTYKIEGMFMTDRYYTATPIPSAPDTQYPTNQGGIYYADYNSENNQLTVKMANATKSYQFSSDIVLTYDEVNKMFIAPELAFAANTNSYLYNRPGIIPDYTIAPYVENEPGEGDGGESSDGGITGTYTVKVGYKNNGTPATSTETITISENNDTKGQYKITGMFDQYGNGGGTYYANYADGILTILSANADNMYIGSLSADISMVHNGISFYSSNGVEAGGYGYVLTSYSAVPNGTVSGITGTYTVKVGYKNNGTPATSTETITISENNDTKGQYKITGMFDQYGNGGGTYYANYANGILTILSANADNMYIGSLSADINMALSDISFYSPDGVEAGSYGYVLTSYSATRN